LAGRFFQYGQQYAASLATIGGVVEAKSRGSNNQPFNRLLKYKSGKEESRLVSDANNKIPKTT
jgi:hypothetical protein